MPGEPDVLAGGLDLFIVEATGYAADPGGQCFRACSQSPVVGSGDGHRPARRRRPWGYAPAAASSAVGTSGALPSGTVPWASLGSAEEVEVYELYNLGFADGLISLTKEVVVDGRYDLVLLNRNCSDLVR